MTEKPSRDLVGIELSVKTTDGAFDSKLMVWPSMLEEGVDGVVGAWLKMMEAAVAAVKPS